MALTATERVKIRFYLGWSARFHQFDSRLEQALNAVDMDSDTETFVRDDLIAALDDIRTKLTDAHGRLKAMKVGSINLPGNQEVMTLRQEGQRHASSLASTLGVEIRHNVFGSQRYRAFASYTGLDETATGGYFQHG